MSEGILIVDDAVIMRRMLKEILVSNGYEVIGEASRKEEGIEKFKELKPALVTMDLILDAENKMAGVQAVREILSIDPEAKVVVVSSIGQKKIRKEVFELGITDYISKPFEEDQVVEVIESILKN